MHVVTVRASPDFRDKAKRAIWSLVWLMLYRPSPTLLFGWRSFLLKLFGADIGPKAHPYPSATIWAPWNLTMKPGSCLGVGVECYNVDRIVLGRDCVVSQRVFLCSASHDHREPGFRLTSGPIEIGDNAWVAANAFVGPGVVVGERSVVAACAVVVRDVPPDAVVAGNPARIVSGKQQEIQLPRAGSK